MEEWRRVPGHSKYEVSSAGRVKSWKPRNRNAVCPIDGRILKGSVNGYGGRNGKVLYRKVTIDGRSMMVHRLVLGAFCGSCPEGFGGRHLNGNSLDNSLKNLAWGTQAENITDKQNGGKAQIGEGHPRAKLTEDVVRLLRLLDADGPIKNQRALASELGISQGALNNAIKGRTWQYLP